MGYNLVDVVSNLFGVKSGCLYLRSGGENDLLMDGVLMDMTF